MRIWSLHPKYLDSKGLVALWRETLLAQKVLAGGTRGYVNHPQLIRFKAQRQPLKTIGSYLRHVWLEANERGYSFDESKIQQELGKASKLRIEVSSGQINYELEHLRNKLELRDPDRLAKLAQAKQIELHPLFTQVPGPIEPWERI